MKLSHITSSVLSALSLSDTPTTPHQDILHKLDHDPLVLADKHQDGGEQGGRNTGALCADTRQTVQPEHVRIPAMWGHF